MHQSTSAVLVPVLDLFLHAVAAAVAVPDRHAEVADCPAGIPAEGPLVRYLAVAGCPVQAVQSLLTACPGGSAFSVSSSHFNCMEGALHQHRQKLEQGDAVTHSSGRGAVAATAERVWPASREMSAYRVASFDKYVCCHLFWGVHALYSR